MVNSSTPGRFELPGVFSSMAYIVAAAFLVWSFQGVGVSVSEFIAGIPSMGDLIGRMMPPDFSRLESISWSLLETFQMALVGTVLGVLISVPLAILAARNLSPHPVIYSATRAMISLFRTIPDLVWGLIFVVTVGLGPFAGMLALMVDTIGFAARFFAESMEEVDRGPQEALTALGSTRTGIIACAIMPGAMPSFIATSLFSLEKATRSSVVLGLVGAGGIGIELKVAMDLFNYPQAATIILGIFLLVLAVERVSSTLRGRIMKERH